MRKKFVIVFSFIVKLKSYQEIRGDLVAWE